MQTSSYETKKTAQLPMTTTGKLGEFAAKVGASKPEAVAKAQKLLA